MDVTLLGAFLIGLFGLTHCLGMCGGIVGALDTGIGGGRPHRGGRLSFHLAYNAGRIASYALAGALAGLLGALAATASFGNALPVGRMIAGLMMIALGLYLAGWWQAMARIEAVGHRLWTRIEPLGRQFLPVQGIPQAFALGLVWGWLPCGLVYSALALAMATTSPAQGALTMAAFGLGTLPALLAMGAFAGALNRFARDPLIRQVAGLTIVLFGLYTCLQAVQGQPHGGHVGATLPCRLIVTA